MIYDRSGMHFPDHKKYILENRLSRRVEDGGFESYEKYINYLKHDAGREKEFASLFNIITTNETFFFRDTTSCRHLNLLPYRIQSKS